VFSKHQRNRIDRLFQRASLYLLLAIAALGGVLRFYQIGSKGLWLDEAFSVWMGWQPVGELLGWLVRIDQHPPLYYVLLHFWMALGDSEATVRGLSALCGTLTIPVMYLVGRRLADKRVGLLAALILAVSPFHVRFAQEARMYTLLALNASLALYALVRLLTDSRAADIALGQQFARAFRAWRTNRRFRLPLRDIETDLAWLGYVVFTTAALVSHNTAVFFPMATNLFVAGLYLVRVSGLRVSVRPQPGRPWPASAFRVQIGVRPQPGRPPDCLQSAPASAFRFGKLEATDVKPETSSSLRPPSLRNWLLAQAIPFLLWSPWLWAFVVQSVGVYREFWIPSPTWQTVVEAIGNFLSSFLPQWMRRSGMVWGLYAVLALLGLVYFRRRPARVAFLFVLFLTPFVGEWLVSLRRPIFYERTLIWASIPVYLLLAAGMRQLHCLPYILPAVLMVLTVNGLSLREYYAHFEKEQWDEAAAFVAERVEADDLILFNATWVQIPFDFYFRSYDRPVAEHGVPVDLFDRGILEPKMTERDLPRLRALIRGHERVWLVYSHDWYTDPQGLIPPALEEELGLVGRWSFHGLQVRLFGRLVH